MKIFMENHSRRNQLQRVSVCALALLAVMACGGRGETYEPGGASSGRGPVAPEAPAPLQAAGKGFTYNFDSDAVGRMPTNFHEGLTGGGARGEWKIAADPTAPSSPNVLAQISSDDTSYRFPLAIADDGSFKDLDMSVRFKAVSGEEDQAGGLVFRLKDADNYYIVRANALENNVVLYKLENGKRSDIDLKGEGSTYGKKASVPRQQWNLLRVVAIGNLFEVYLNGEKLFEVEDDTFKEAGKVGLWTKADSVTYFDDLQVTAR